MIATVVIALVMARAPMSSSLLFGGMASAGATFALIVGILHGYDARRTAAGPQEYRAVLRAGWAWASLLVGLAYVSAVELPAAQLLAAIGATVVAVLLARCLQRMLVRHYRRQGEWLRRTLLVGDAKRLESLVAQFQAHPSFGFDIIGACLSAPVPPAPSWLAAPVLGDIERAADVVVEHGIRVVVVAANCMDPIELRRLCWELERHHIELIIAPSIEEVAPERVELHSISGTPLLTVNIGAGRGRRIVKACLDRSLGVVLMIAALPVLAVSALLVRMTSSGPAFYRQTRMGRCGTPFTMIKLRTMHTGADRSRAALLECNDGNAIMFKMRQDPRVTPVGRVLRRLSIDELPQLWNVIRGDMSLVGPRPPLREEVAGYDHDAKQRLRVKPGLTGLWQVSGRSDLSWVQTLRLDLSYVDNWTVVLDLTILWRTIRAVIGGRGAY